MTKQHELCMTRDKRIVTKLHKFYSEYQIWMLKGVVTETDGREVEYTWHLGGSWLGMRLKSKSDLMIFREEAK